VTTPLPPFTGDINWQCLSNRSMAILRQVLIPIHLEGSTIRETAKRLQIPQKAVRLLEEYFVWEVRLQRVLIPIRDEGCTIAEVADRLRIPEESVRFVTEYFADEST
jgi:hypothetical protein